MEANRGRVMGIDFGESRIGIALSDPLGIMATPLTIIHRTEESADINAITDIIRENGVVKVVIGLPLSMDGSAGRQAARVSEFAAALEKQTDVPIKYQDERLSTVTAKNLVQQARKTDRHTRYDDAAAALILQSYLDQGAPPDIPPE